MRFSVLIITLAVFLSCTEVQPRRPKSSSTKNFYQEVLEENKKLIRLEERNIEALIAKDTVSNYQISNSGFWYSYIKKDTFGQVFPKPDDIVTIRYNITDVFDNEIYGERELTYKVDKEDLISGLNDGVKLMKTSEEVVFIIPSYRAYGVTGDGNKIGINKTLKSNVKLIEIKKTNP